MKRAILILAALALVACGVSAQPTNVDVIYDVSGMATIRWDAVTEDIDDEPYLLTDTITYELFTYDTALFGVDDQNLANVDSLGVVGTETGDIDFSVYPRGSYRYVGVRSIVDDGLGTVEYSTIAWSYDPVATDPTSRLAYAIIKPPKSPKPPQALRASGM